MVVHPDADSKVKIRSTQPNIMQEGGTRRPRPPALWTNGEVVQWFERHLHNLHNVTQYSVLFKNHNVTGVALLRINESALERMGIVDEAHREVIWREIIKLKLKADILELRLIEHQVK